MDIKNVIGFHNPDEVYGFFSNWYLSEFKVQEICYSSMEQYMMYQKAVLFQDEEIANQILQTNDVAQIKAFGRMVKDYEDSIWNGCRQIIIYRGLLEKFRQNTGLREALLDTGDAVLAECAVRDTIWGIGLSMQDERRFDIKKWRGQNLLGYALMEVRSQLKRRI